MKKINQVLKKHQLTIRGLIKIIGKKETITQLMACLFQEKYTCLEEVFSPTICKKSRWFLTELGMYHQLQKRILQLDQKENDLLLFYIASTLTQYESVAALVGKSAHISYMTDIGYFFSNSIPLSNPSKWS